MAEPIFSKVSEFMTDTVIFSAPSSKDKYNKTTFATSGSGVLSVKGRLIYDDTKSKDVQGTERFNIGRFITDGPRTSITVNHRMVVGTDTFTVNAVDQLADENGAHHTVIKFGR
jgi:hypothetical protein